MATIDLGKIKLVNRGAYNNSTAYTVDDLVQSGGTTYICIQNSTGNAVTDTSYWNVLAQKGSDGTDVGTTLTTQGDILYRDGSGLQRLAAGTSGQVLQTGGAGANPSWGTVSSDYVKLISTTVSSTTAYVELTDFINPIYGGYKILITNLKKTGTTDCTWRIRFKYGSTIVSNSTYRGGYEGVNYNNSNAASQQQGGYWDSDQAEISNWNTPDTRQSQNGANIQIWMPEIKTDSDKQMQYYRSNLHASGTYINWSTGMFYNTDSSLRGSDMTASGSGFRFYPVADDIASGQFTVYGIKK
jgi:hypothetical protein